MVLQSKTTVASNKMQTGTKAFRSLLSNQNHLDISMIGRIGVSIELSSHEAQTI